MRHVHWRKELILLVQPLALVLASVPSAWGNEVFDERGFSPVRETFSEVSYEHIDPLTGNLLLTFTDLVLPGNAGLDLRIQRTYNSKIHADYERYGVRLGEDSWAGLGWRLHFGRLLNADRAVPGPIEMPDGSQHKLFTHISSPGLFITREYWVYDPGQRQLRLPNGVTYKLDRETTIYDGLANVNVLYTTQIRDPFGNTITVEYQSSGPPDAIARVVQDLGSGQQRTVTFQTDTTVRRALSKMTYNSGEKTYEWKYDHRQIRSIDNGPYSLLVQVVGPEELKWDFTYDTSTPVSGMETFELKRLATPYGGRIDYMYEEERAEIGYGNYVTFRAVNERTVSGRGLRTGTWTYDWTRLSPTLGGYSTVVSPCGSLTQYAFELYGGANTNWKVGSLLRKTVAAPSSCSTCWPSSGWLENETFEWQPSEPISLDDESKSPFWHDSSIFVPLLKRRTVRRDDDYTYRTDYEYHTTSFNDYGRAWKVVESGDAGTRTTERTFVYGFTPYIKDKVGSEKVTVRREYPYFNESFSRSWVYDLSNGFLTDRYGWGSTTTSGIHTSYGITGDRRGNVGAVTDGNNHTTTYSYSWGVLSRVVTPAYPSIDTLKRTINPEGTIAKETRQVATWMDSSFQAATTKFEYDLLFRQTEKTPPLGNPIVTTYDDGTAPSITVTRGSVTDQYSRVVTSLDGFGRPVATENGVGVKTSKSYDPCGRVIYESYPYVGWTHEGISYVYDGLNRLRYRTNTADGTYSSFGYAGLDVTITDENRHVTSQHWASFGGPADALLLSVTAGVGSAVANTTAYDYNALGKLRAATHPGELARRWDYLPENGLLKTETQPESGTVWLTYDKAGNLKTRTDRAFGQTSFEYDDNNRATTIYRPSPNPTAAGYSAAYWYDPANKVTQAWNSYVYSTFTYDLAGRLGGRSDQILGEAPFATEYRYDGNDNLELVHYPRSWYGPTADSMWLRYTHDSEGRIASVGTDARPELFAHTFTYHPSGAVEGFTAGNGIKHEITHDERQRVKDIDSGGVLGLTYGYDDVGNPTSIIDRSRPGTSQTFGYDELDRLETAIGFWGLGNFTYDALGNQLTRTMGTDSTTFTIDAATNRLSSTAGSDQRTFSYDGNGNMISDSVHTYTYTPENLVSTVPIGLGTVGHDKTVTYRYDFDMKRKAVLSATGDYFYVHGPGGQLLTEFERMCDGTFIRVRDYVYAGDRLVASSQPAGGRPSFGFTTPASVTAEGDGVTVGVQLTTPDRMPTKCAATVSYGAVAGSAVEGKDWTLIPGRLVFPAGTKSGATQTITIQTAADVLDEDDETFSARLHGSTGAGIGQSTHTVTIADDDPAPTVSIGPAITTALEGDSGLVPVSFTVSLSAVSGRTVSVAYAAFPGTATAGVDYQNAAGTLVFPAETGTSTTVVVMVVGDAEVESHEDFTVGLSNPPNATLAGGPARVVIQNDDIPTVHLISPNGGEVWPVNSIQTISWTAPKLSRGATISLSYGNGKATYPIANGIAPAVTSWLWTVPRAPGTAWTVTVCSDVGNSCEAQDSSDAPFTILDRRTIRPARLDLNADRQNDFLWRYPPTGDLVAWYMDGMTQAGGAALSEKPGNVNWVPVATGDSNGDTKPDILFRYQPRGDLVVWVMDGVTRTGGGATVPPMATPPWVIVAPR